MKNIYIVIISIILTIAVLLGGVYLALTHFQHRAKLLEADQFAYIPPDAHFILHLKSPVNLFTPGNKAKSRMNNGLGDGTITNWFGIIKHVDSTLSANINYHNAWLKADILISGHGQEFQNTDNTLLQILIPQGFKARRLGKKIFSDFVSTIRSGFIDYKTQKIHRIELFNDTIYTTINYSSLKFSYSLALLKESIESGLQKNSISRNKDIKKLRVLAGQFQDNFYFNMQSICNLMNTYSGILWPFTITCSEMMGWQVWDITYHAGHHIFHGFSAAANQKNLIATLLNGQKPIIPTIYKVLPPTAGSLFYIGLSDTEPFGQLLKEHFSKTINADHLAYLQRQFAETTKIPPENLAGIWMGELAHLQIDPNLINGDLIILTTSGKQNIIEHPQLADFIDEVTLNRPSNDDTLTIYRLQIPGFIPIITKGLVKYDYNYAIFKGNILIAAKQKQTLLMYLDKPDVELGHENMSIYNPATTKSPKKFNIKWQILSPAKPSNLTQKLLTSLSGSVFSFDRMGFVALQISSSQETHVFSNLVVSEIEDYTFDTRLAWQTPLMDSIHKGPFKVNNHIDNSTEIIVQDTSNNLYLIDFQGNIIWNLKLSGPIQSEIFQVDKFKNNRYQYLFNTRNYLHLIDRNGKYVDGFPMRLPSPATTGIAVFDYDRNKDYRIIIPAENRRIYNYSLNRKSVPGWNPDLSVDIISEPLQHVRLDGKDYIFAIDNLGNLKILNRQGRERITITEELKVNPQSQVFTSIIGNNPHFVIAGIHGEVNLIRPDGNVKIVRPDTFTVDHQFYWKNSTPGKNPQLIYVDQGVLSVYTFPDLLKFSSPLQIGMNPEISVIKHDTRGYIIVIADFDNKRILMVDTMGSIIESSNITGNKAHFIEIKNHNHYLITGLNEMVVCYILDL